MALKDIPALREDYPLYDWGDWQSSRDALVSGTPTKRFAKEAWNAIVDTLDNALASAGLLWDSTYTTAPGAKITEAYGKLTAEKFNSLRHNIDHPAPLGWAWADKPDFRGYVGRVDFQGRQAVGKDCDKVYAEYIIELVRKLNLLLELMRGTALIADAGKQLLLKLQRELELVAGKSAPVGAAWLAQVEPTGQLLALPGLPMGGMLAVFTQTDSTMAAPPSFPMEGAVETFSTERARGESKPGLPLRGSVLLPGLTAAELMSARMKEVSGRSAHWSSATAHPWQLPGLPGQTEGLYASSSRASALLRPPLPTQGSVLATVLPRAAGGQAPGQPGSASLLPRALGRGEAATAPALAGGAWQRSTLQTAAKLSTAWYPPLWVEGGLWVRQVHRAEENEMGELVIT